MNARIAVLAYGLLFAFGCAANDQTCERITLSGMTLEVCVTEMCSVVYKRQAPLGTAQMQAYVLPSDGAKFRLLWERLQRLPPAAQHERGCERIALEGNGRLVAEFVIDSDESASPFWHGVVREIEASARADLADALASRQIAEFYAGEAEWFTASQFWMDALDSAIAAHMLQSRVLGRGDIVIDDCELRAIEPRSLFWAGKYEDAVMAFRASWNALISSWVNVEKRDGRVEVTVSGKAPDCGRFGTISNACIE